MRAVVLLSGGLDSLLAAHSKARDRGEVRVLVKSGGRAAAETLTVAPAGAEMIAALRAGS